MKARRRVIAIAALLGMGGPFAVLAQGPRLRRIGLLLPSSMTQQVAALRARLRERGWIEGQNLEIEIRTADNAFERFPALARELIERHVELIVVSPTRGAQAAKASTATIPIVFAHVADAVGAGLVASLPRPGGNVTGVANRALEIAVKQIELLKALVPGLERVAELRHPRMGAAVTRTMTEQLEAAAMQSGLRLVQVDADTAEDLVAAFAAAARERATGMVVPPAPLYFQQAKRIAELAREHRIATVSASRTKVVAGGLASYGLDFTDAFARTSRYVDAILRGAKPADLPVEQADRFEIAINRSTAAALGLKLSPAVLLQATEVIE